MTDNDVKVEPSTSVSFIAHLQKPREADNSDGRKRRKAKTKNGCEIICMIHK